MFVTAVMGAVLIHILLIADPAILTIFRGHAVYSRALLCYNVKEMPSGLTTVMLPASVRNNERLSSTSGRPRQWQMSALTTEE